MGKYSHVAMFLGYSSYIEADLNGVHTRNPQRLHFEEKDEIMVRRTIVELEASQIEKICFYLKRRTAAPYSIFNAIMSITKVGNINEPGKHFCSQLISEGFKQVNIGVNKSKDSAKITPADFEFSSEFVTISGVLLELSDEDTESYLKSINKFDLLTFQQNAINDLMRQLKSVLKEFGHSPDTPSEAFSDIIFNGSPEADQIDKQVSKILLQSDYINVAERDREERPNLHDPNAVERVYRYPERVPIVLKKDLVNDILKRRDTQEAREEDKVIDFVAALINPKGRDSKKEWLTIINKSNRQVNLKDWIILNQKGQVMKFDGKLNSGDVKKIWTKDHKDFSLANSDGILVLRNPNNDTVDIATYSKSDVIEDKIYLF